MDTITWPVGCLPEGAPQVKMKTYLIVMLWLTGCQSELVEAEWKAGFGFKHLVKK